MGALFKRIEIYVARDGRIPFIEWLNTLKDVKGRAKIRVRIDRLSVGNLGDCRAIGSGVYELRIDYGPGYRVYFGQAGAGFALLLCAGNKDSQKADIKKALAYWEDFKRK